VAASGPASRSARAATKASAIVPTSSSVSDQDVADIVAETHDAVLGATRCAKALVEFARTAGQRLVEARTAIGSKAFDRWVDRTLAITPGEAKALLDFAQDPGVGMAEVSPSQAMTLTEAMQLVAQLCHHFHR
jgi:hypothetical protein